MFLIKLLSVTYCLSGTNCILPILGGWLADAKFGKHSVILFSAVIYLIGTILLPLGSITKDEKEHSNWAATDLTTIHAFKMAVYISGLILVAFGNCGIAGNVPAFGAEQISYRGPAAIQGADSSSSSSSSPSPSSPSSCISPNIVPFII